MYMSSSLSASSNGNVPFVPFASSSRLFFLSPLGDVLLSQVHRAIGQNSPRSIRGMIDGALVGFADNDFLVTRGPRRADSGTDCREADMNFGTIASAATFSAVTSPVSSSL